MSGTLGGSKQRRAVRIARGTREGGCWFGARDLYCAVEPTYSVPLATLRYTGELQCVENVTNASQNNKSCLTMESPPTGVGP